MASIGSVTLGHGVARGVRAPGLRGRVGALIPRPPLRPHLPATGTSFTVYAPVGYTSFSPAADRTPAAVTMYTRSFTSGAVVSSTVRPSAETSAFSTLATVRSSSGEP